MKKRGGREEERRGEERKRRKNQAEESLGATQGRAGGANSSGAWRADRFWMPAVGGIITVLSRILPYLTLARPLFLLH